jgi:predicted transcriptional regulator
VKTNPSLLVRAEFAGDLRSSALACLQYDAPSGVSEAELAQLCGTALEAMHKALDGLEQGDMVRRSRAGRNRRVSLKQLVPRLAVRA